MNLVNNLAGQVVKFDLPRSNFLSAFGFQINISGTGALTGSHTLDHVRVRANGSGVWLDVTGGELRAIDKFETGRENATFGGLNANIFEAYYLFGRFRQDEQVLFPAKVFKTLQVEFTVSTGAFATSLNSSLLSLWTEELVSNVDPRTKAVRKLTSLATLATNGASKEFKQKMGLGNIVRGIYLHATDIPALGANGAAAATGDRDLSGTGTIDLIVNNGAEVPISQTLQAIAARNVGTYRLQDGVLPGAEATSPLSNDFQGAAVSDLMVKLDFDIDDSGRYAIDTSRMNELQVGITAGANATNAMSVTYITDEILAVG